MNLYWCEVGQALEGFVVERGLRAAIEEFSESSGYEPEAVRGRLVAPIPPELAQRPVSPEEFTLELRDDFLRKCGGTKVGFLGVAPRLRELEASWRREQQLGTPQERRRARMLLLQMYSDLHMHGCWRQVWRFGEVLCVPNDDLLLLVQEGAGGTN